jgi:hypothetical protein
MHRGWMDNPVFSAEPFTERTAWVWMIETAAWEPCRKRVAGFLIDLGRGQLVGSVRYLAEAWKWSKSRVDRFIGRLANDAMIGTDTTLGVNVITICNYDKYQSLRDTSVASSGTAAGQQRDTERDKEETTKPLNKRKREANASLNSEIEAEFLRWYAAFPRKADPGRAAKAYRTARNFASAANLFDGALRYSAECDGKDPQFVKMPATWLNARSWENETVTPSASNGHGRAQQQTPVGNLFLGAFAAVEERERERQAHRREGDDPAFALLDRK